MDAPQTNKTHLPPVFSRAWWRLAGRAFWIGTKDLYRDHGPFWAAAIAFYALFSALPLLVLAAIGASFFVEPSWAVERITELFGELIPVGEEEVAEVVENTYEARGAAGLASIAAILWSGTRVFGSITHSLNIAFDVPELYGWLKRYLVELLMLCTLGVLILTAFLSTLLLDEVWQLAGLDSEERSLLFAALRFTLPFALVTLAFTLVYRFIPRRRPDWSTAAAGGVISTALFFLAQWLFYHYAERFADYEVMYGPIALLILLIFWFWIGALILLYGGELVSHFQDILVEGMPPDEVEARHEREEPTREAK